MKKKSNKNLVSTCLFCGKELIQEDNKPFKPCDCFINKKESPMSEIESLKKLIYQLDGDMTTLLKEIIPELKSENERLLNRIKCLECSLSQSKPFTITKCVSDKRIDDKEI